MEAGLLWTCYSTADGFRSITGADQVTRPLIKQQPRALIRFYQSAEKHHSSPLIISSFIVHSCFNSLQEALEGEDL